MRPIFYDQRRTGAGDDPDGTETRGRQRVSGADGSHGDRRPAHLYAADARAHPGCVYVFDDASRLLSSIPGVVRPPRRPAAPKNAGRTAPWGSPKPTLAGVASTLELSKTGERG